MNLPPPDVPFLQEMLIINGRVCLEGKRRGSLWGMFETVERSDPMEAFASKSLIAAIQASKDIATL